MLAHKWLDEIDAEKFKPSTTNVPSAPLSDWPTNLQSNFYNCGFTRFAPRWPTSYEAVSFQKGDDWLDGFAKGESRYIDNLGIFCLISLKLSSAL